MYTLRKISKKGKYEMNISLGKGYTLTTRESEKEFNEYLEANKNRARNAMKTAEARIFNLRMK